MSQETLETLRQSMSKLSESNTIHMENTAMQLAQTRICLMKAEGFDMTDILDLTSRYNQITKLDDQILNLQNVKNGLEDQIENLKNKLKELETKTSV